MTLTINELKERIVQNEDPDFIVEILEISTDELLEAFHDKLEEHLEYFLYLEENEILYRDD